MYLVNTIIMFNTNKHHLSNTYIKTCVELDNLHLSAL